MLCQLGHKDNHDITPSPPPPLNALPSDDNSHPSQRSSQDNTSDTLDSDFTDFSIFLAADKLMQLSGRSKGRSSIVHHLQQLNGVVKQPLLRHRDGESAEFANSESTGGELAMKSEHTSSTAAVNDQSKAPPPELHNSSHEVNSSDTKSTTDDLDGKMEISENGATESDMNEHSENFDSKLTTPEPCKGGETERSNGVGGMQLSMNGAVVNGEEGRGRVCEGEGGGETLANEEHMDVSEEEECGSEEQGHPPQGGGIPGYQPGFGKHQGGSVVYTD